jgi:hypothetical protein
MDNNHSNLKVSYPSHFTNGRGKARRMDIEEVRNFWIEEKVKCGEKIKRKMDGPNYKSSTTNILKMIND